MTDSPQPTSDLTSERLRATAGAPTLLVALDFDGVLADFQLDPLTSFPRPASAEAYRRLGPAAGVTLAFISGRDLDDLRTRVDPPPGTLLAGSHGAQVDDSALSKGDARAVEGAAHEPSDLERAQLQSLDRDLAALGGELAGFGEFRIEPKPLGRTLHTRGLSEEFAAALIEGAYRVHRAHPEFRYTSGHGVVEYAVRHRTKGDALTEFRDLVAPAATLYIGDDTTDEDAFARLDQGRSPWPDLGIKVGGGDTLAAARIAGLDDVTRVLDALVALREA